MRLPFSRWKIVPIIQTGRGLWVNGDESLVYFASNFVVKKWTPQRGVEVVAQGFRSLGNLAVDPAGRLVVTDRKGHRVYRIEEDGSPAPIAGNGATDGGGDGALALDTGLNGVRGIWILASGGYFLATHDGCQVWYVDTRGIIHLFLDGGPGSHSGDGEPFRTPGLKIANPRAVTVDPAGNLIITENDYGFIRRVERR